MANPILTSDILQDDGEILKVIKQLETAKSKIEGLYSTVKKEAAALADSVKSVNIATKSGQEQIRNNAKQANELAKQSAKYNNLLQAEEVKIQALKNANAKLTKARKLEAETLQTQGGSLNNLNAQLKLNKLRLDQMTEEQKKSTKEGYKLVEQTGRLEVKIKEIKKERSENIKKLQLEREATNGAEDSHKRLSAQYRLNIARIKEMGEEWQFTTEEGKKFTKETNDLNDRLKAIEKGYGSTGRNVGNYKEDIIEALKAQKLLSKEIETTKEEFDKLPASLKTNSEVAKAWEKRVKTLDEKYANLSKQTGATRKDLDKFGESQDSLLDSASEMPGALGGAANGVKRLGKQFTKLLRNPVVAVIAAIVAALAVLAGAFTKSESGANKLAYVSGVLKGLFSELIGLSTKVADAITGAFKNPLKTVKGFGKALKDNVVGFFKDPKGTIKGFGDNIKETFDDVKKSVTETADKFGKLGVAQRKIRAINAELVKSASDLTTEQEKYLRIADDATLSTNRRQEALKQSQEISKQLAANELAQTRNTLSVLNKEIALRKANNEDVLALTEQQAQAYEALGTARRNAANVGYEAERKTRELTEEELERELDFLLDITDKKLQANRDLLSDEDISFSERRKILEDTKELTEKSVRDQIAVIQSFTDEKINADELINESDAKVVSEKVKNLNLSDKISGRLLEIIRDRIDSNADLLSSEKELTKAEKESIKEAEKASLEKKKQAYENELELFDLNQQLQLSEFDLLNKSEKEKNKFILEQEKERIKKILGLNKLLYKTLSDTEISINENILKKLEADIAKLDADIEKGDKKTIWDLIGLGDDENDESKREQLKKSLDFAKNQIFEYAAARTAAAQQAVNDANTEVQSAENAVQAEIANRNAGYANNVETAQKELAAAKENQKKALEERRKAQRAELALQSVEQASNLVTASAKIWKDLSFPAALPAIGIMWGSFIAAKIRAAQLTKKKFAKGGLEIIGGGSHASGNDTYLGFQSEGKAAYGERGEAHMILNKKRTAQYKNVLPTIFNSLDQGNFDKIFNAHDSAIKADIKYNNSLSTDKMENELMRIRKQGEISYYNDNGVTVRRYRNKTTRIHGSK